MMKNQQYRAEAEALHTDLVADVRAAHRAKFWLRADGNDPSAPDFLPMVDFQPVILLSPEAYDSLLSYHYSGQSFLHIEPVTGEKQFKGCPVRVSRDCNHPYELFFTPIRGK